MVPMLLRRQGATWSLLISEGVGSVCAGENAPGLITIVVEMEEKLRGWGGAGPRKGNQP